MRLLTIAAALVATSACTSVVADAGTFEGTEWRVTAIDSQPTQPGLSLRFSGGQLSGYLGCNHFSGPYRVDGNSLTVRPLAMTRMACATPVDDPRPSFERGRIAILSSPMRITWRSGRELTLSNAAGSITLQKTP